MRRLVRRMLVRGITASILLPTIVGLVLGLGSLLHALGDAAGATWCVRVAQVAGLAWVLAVGVTAVMSGVMALEEKPRGGRHRGRGERCGGGRAPWMRQRRHHRRSHRPDRDPPGPPGGDPGLG